MKRFGLILVCAILITGCQASNTHMKPKGVFAPVISKRGSHIWIKPGTNTTNISIGRFTKW